MFKSVAYIPIDYRFFLFKKKEEKHHFETKYMYLWIY